MLYAPPNYSLFNLIALTTSDEEYTLWSSISFSCLQCPVNGSLFAGDSLKYKGNFHTVVLTYLTFATQQSYRSQCHDCCSYHMYQRRVVCRNSVFVGGMCKFRETHRTLSARHGDSVASTRTGAPCSVTTVRPYLSMSIHSYKLHNGVWFPTEKEMFLYSTASTPSRGPTQPPAVIR
jgi:hypothetical protein